VLWWCPGVRYRDDTAGLSMEFTEYWKAVIKKYPPLKDEETRISISVKSLKDLMRQSHEKGAEMKPAPLGEASVEYLRDLFGFK
jgi:hypothetical protein